MAAMAASENPATALLLNFYISVCVDADASGPVLESFRRFFDSFARKNRWTFVMSTCPQQQLSAPRAKGENLFVRMDGTFRPCPCGRLHKRFRDDFDKFDSLSIRIKDAVKTKKFLNSCGKNKLAIIAWGLSAANRPVEYPRMTRWIMPVNTHPIPTTMQDLEVQMHNNLSQNVRKLDSAHDACGHGATLGCIESYLWQQKVSYNLLNDAVDALEAADTDNAAKPPTNTKELIHNAIMAGEALDKSLSSLVALIDDRVGRFPAVEGRWKPFSALWAFVRGPLRAVAIDDADLEGHKKQARRLLGEFQHLLPVLVLHIRLHDGEKRVSLWNAYDKAAPDAEKREMVERLAATPDSLKTKQNRAETMKRVWGAQKDSYERVVAEVEAVNKLIGAEYCRRGQEMFKVRPRPGNGLGGTRVAGTVMNPQRPCRLDSRESDDSSMWSVEVWDEKGKA